MQEIDDINESAEKYLIVNVRKREKCVRSKFSNYHIEKAGAFWCSQHRIARMLSVIQGFSASNLKDRKTGQHL